MTNPISRILPVIVLFGFLTGEYRAAALAGDGLNQLQSEARSSGPFDSPPHWSSEQAKPAQKNENDADSFDDDGYEFDIGLVGVVAFGTVVAASSPFWGPARLVRDDYTSQAFFARYPYQQPVDGYLMIAPVVPRKPREWAGRAFVENGGDLDDITTWNGGLLLETTHRFGIDSSARYYSQQVAINDEDNLWVGDANLVFRFAQSSKLEMRTGIGFNWLHDSAGSDAGFNFTYGGDWFPMNPFVVSSELDWGEIGHASLFHVRVTAGVQWHRAEIYAGYDYLDVGNAQLDTWIAGLRIWF